MISWQVLRLFFQVIVFVYFLVWWVELFHFYLLEEVRPFFFLENYLSFYLANKTYLFCIFPLKMIYLFFCLDICHEKKTCPVSSLCHNHVYLCLHLCLFDICPWMMNDLFCSICPLKKTGLSCDP